MKTVSLPLAGRKVKLAFSIEALEALYEAYGGDYIAETLRRLNLRDPKCLRLCLEHAASEKVELAEIVQKMPLDDLVVKVADALNIALTGKPVGD